MNKSVFGLFIAALIVTAIILSQQRDNKQRNLTQTPLNTVGNFNYYLLEVEWQGTVCKTNSCTSEYIGLSNSSNFNIHGLWPSGINGNACDYPSDCGTTPFSFSLLTTSTISYIKSYWVGLYSPQQDFLNHEWTKHGTCQAGSQETYFSNVSTIHKKYNVISALETVNIVPSDSISYKLDDIQNTLDSTFLTAVFLKCIFHNGQQMLLAVNFHLNSSLTNLIPQPCKKITNCSSQQEIYIPLM